MHPIYSNQDAPFDMGNRYKKKNGTFHGSFMTRPAGGTGSTRLSYHASHPIYSNQDARFGMGKTGTKKRRDVSRVIHDPTRARYRLYTSIVPCIPYAATKTLHSIWVTGTKKNGTFHGSRTGPREAQASHHALKPLPRAPTHTWGMLPPCPPWHTR